ncbi:hypothetical protein HDU67_002785 [Dinochytrium kinnereticum]|nr:hypothetical protein HDU67_002785 [Dinochytrium kinnereticum]
MRYAERLSKKSSGGFVAPNGECHAVRPTVQFPGTCEVLNRSIARESSHNLTTSANQRCYLLGNPAILEKNSYSTSYDAWLKVGTPATINGVSGIFNSAAQVTSAIASTTRTLPTKTSRPSSSTRKSTPSSTGPVIGGVIFGMALFVMLAMYGYQKQKKEELKKNQIKDTSSAPNSKAVVVDTPQHIKPQLSHGHIYPSQQSVVYIPDTQSQGMAWQPPHPNQQYSQAAQQQHFSYQMPQQMYIASPTQPNHNGTAHYPTQEYTITVQAPTPSPYPFPAVGSTYGQTAFHVQGSAAVVVCQNILFTQAPAAIF